MDLLFELLDKLYSANSLEKDELILLLKSVGDARKEVLFDYFVLQSGEGLWYTEDKLADIVGSIKTLFTDAAVTLSIG